MDGATEHTRAPAMKTRDVMSNIFRRPKRSERVPPLMAVTAAPTNTTLTTSPCSNVERPKLVLIKISAPAMTPVLYPASNPPIATNIAAMQTYRWLATGMRDVCSGIAGSKRFDSTVHLLPQSGSRVSAYSKAAWRRRAHHGGKAVAGSARSSRRGRLSWTRHLFGSGYSGLGQVSGPGLRTRTPRGWV